MNNVKMPTIFLLFIEMCIQSFYSFIWICSFKHVRNEIPNINNINSIAQIDEYDHGRIADHVG